MMSTCQVGINDDDLGKKSGARSCRLRVPFLLFRLQDGFTVPPWLTFPEAHPRASGRFLKRHESNIWASAFFSAQTTLFQTLYVFLVIRHVNREIVRVAATAYPSANWAAQQIVESCTFFPPSGAISTIRNLEAQWRPNWDVGLRAKPQAHWDATSARRPHRRYSGSSKRCLPGHTATSNRNWRYILATYRLYEN